MSKQPVKESVHVKAVGEMDPEACQRRVMRPEGEERLGDGDHAERGDREKHQAPFEATGLRCQRQGASHQMVGRPLQGKITGGGSDRIERGPPGERPWGGIGKTLRDEICDPEDEDGTQRKRLRRLVPEAEEEADYAVDDERQKEGAGNRKPSGTATGPGLRVAETASIAPPEERKACAL